MRSSSEWLTAWLAAVLPEIYTGMKIPTNPATGSQPILGANRPSTKHLSAATVSTTNSMHTLRLHETQSRTGEPMDRHGLRPRDDDIG